MVDIINIVGLLLNLSGAILLAFSVKVEGVASQDQGVRIGIMGKEMTKTVIDKKLFRFGVIVLIFGFLAQLISTVI